ncbi:MAG: hypothetical protein H6557_28545 [Lewinellaceae bacterium]|nr:hypothetical protein [Phaeodactylibacter sp.]MCB9040595.1 hypothetical protein [Lewinellaceae bacterium]
MIIGVNLNHDYAYCVIDNDRVYLREVERVSRLRYHFNETSTTLSLLDDFSKKELQQVKAIYMASPRIFGIERKNGDLSSVKREYYYVGEYPNKYNYERTTTYGKILVEGLEIPAAWVVHHNAHAASTFWPSPYKKADIMILDGGGDIGYGAWFTGDHYDISVKERYIKVMLGLSYTNFSQKVYHANQGMYESKVMAIASYGNKDLSQWQYLKDGHYGNGLTPFPDEKISIHDIARFQYDFEQEALKLARRGKTDNEYLCCAGGCFLNVGLNRAIADSGLYKGVFVPPYTGDMGIPIGCALFACKDLGEPMPSRERLRTPFLGDKIEISLSELESLIYQAGDQAVVAEPNSIIAN